MFPLTNSPGVTPMLGSFVYESGAASSPHDPIVTLASHLLRSTFGPAVQAVADCLQCRGNSTFGELVYYLQQHKKRKCTDATTVTTPQIRAALLVLMQHSIVTAREVKGGSAASKKSDTKAGSKTKSRKGGIVTYSYDTAMVLYILRYAKCVEYVKKAVDATASCVIQELLQHGRLRTVDLVVQAAQAAPKSEKYTVRQTVLDALTKLVNAGFLEQVPERRVQFDDDDDEDEFEFEFEELEPAKKRVKLDVPDDKTENDLFQHEDPAVVALLKHHSHYKSALPVDAVWRINMQLFHESLRANTLGKLVAERHGHRVQSAGSLVTAALRHLAYVKHGAQSRKMEAGNHDDDTDQTMFAVSDIVKYLPKPVLQLYEKKSGGVVHNLIKALDQLSEIGNPITIRKAGADLYEVVVSGLVNYLRDRIVYQVVQDRHGKLAARVISILAHKGWIQSEQLAEFAMIPQKDTREVLHHLYRSSYVQIFQLSSSRQYNAANMIYLWCIERKSLVRNVCEHVATGLSNIRLRREHEVQVGQNWIERARAMDTTDENSHEKDKLNYRKFCLGLERLDVAALQLDETLMVLRNF